MKTGIKERSAPMILSVITGGVLAVAFIAFRYFMIEAMAGAVGLFAALSIRLYLTGSFRQKSLYSIMSLLACLLLIAAISGRVLYYLQNKFAIP